MALYLDGVVVSHVPREISKVFWFCLKHNGKIMCEITGGRKRGNGLEVLCAYKLKSSSSMVEKAKEMLVIDCHSLLLRFYHNIVQKIATLRSFVSQSYVQVYVKTEVVCRSVK